MTSDARSVEPEDVEAGQTDRSAEAPSSSEGRLSRWSKARLLLALICSHVLAPYASARVVIRFQLQGDVEKFYAVQTAVFLTIGLVLAWRQLVCLPGRRKVLWISGLLVLWLGVSFALLAVASHSEIPAFILGVLWAGGSLWIVWTVWAWSLFRSREVLIGTVLVGLLAVPFWVFVEATGLRGDTRVEFAWRKPRQTIEIAPESGPVESTGAVLWPGYLGTARNSVLEGIALDPDWNSRPPETLWRQPCGLGWSSFAVTETTLFTQEQLPAGDCVTARDLETGRLLWAAPDGSERYRSGLGGDGPRATPALHLLTDETDAAATRLVLYTAGPKGIVRCLDAATGKDIWKTNLMELYPGEELVHGVCGSPLVLNDVVIVCPPAENGPCLAALDQRTGRPVWKCASSWRASYASPALMTICEQPQIVLHAGPGVISVDPETGTPLWQYEWTNEFDNNATQPLQVQDDPDDLFVATGYRGGIARISIRRKDDGALQVSETWSTRRLMRTRFSSVAQFGDAVVGLDDNILCAVDAATGKRLWKKQRYGHGQILRVADLLLVVEEKGSIRLLKPDRTGPHPVGDAFPALDRKTWSHPVLVGDRLFVRNDRQMVCVRLPLLSPPAGN